MKPINIIVISIIVFLFFFLRIGCKNAEIASLETSLSLSELNNQKYEKIVNTLEDTILKQRAIIIKDKEQLKTFTDSIFNLKQKVKAVTAFYKETTKTVWDTVYIPYDSTPTIPQVQYGDTITKEIKNYIDSSIKVPNKFSKDSSLFSIKGEVTKQGVRIDSLNIPDTFNLRIVETKGKLFKPSFVEFQSFHTNKLVQVTGVNSIMYKLPKKTFWQVVLDKLIWVGVGIGLTTIK